MFNEIKIKILINKGSIICEKYFFYEKIGNSKETDNIII